MTIPYSIVDLDGPVYDRVADVPAPVRRKVFVCSPPRTGSYLLCEALRQSGIGIPHEYFNTPTVETLARRWRLEIPRPRSSWRFPGSSRRGDSAVAAYIEALAQRRSQCAIFAAKIQFWQYRRYLDNPSGEALLHGAEFLYLYRAALLDQAISLRFARITGQWGVDGAVTTPVQGRADFFDLGEIDRAVRDILAEEAGWRKFFAQRGIEPRIHCYETVRHDPFLVARKLAPALGHECAMPDTASSLPPVPRSDDPLRTLRIEVRATYLARRARNIPATRWPIAPGSTPA
jgi:LPS sulfotransferase NodH